MKSFSRQFILFILSLIVCLNLLAQSVYTITAENETITIPVAILNPSTDFITAFILINNSNSDKEYVLEAPKTGLITCLIVSDEDSLHQVLKTGSSLPLAGRSLHSNTNGIVVTLFKGVPLLIQMEFKIGYSIYRHKSISIKAEPLSAFERQDSKRLLWQGLFLGIILVMALYNLIIYFAVKDISYLYFVLSIFGVGLYFAFYYGIGFEYLWPKAPIWETFCYTMIVPFNGLMRLYFTKTYLHTAELMPRTNRILNALAVICGICITLGFITYIFRIDILSSLVTIIGILGSVILLMMLISGYVAYYNRGYQPGKYFIIANLLLVIGAVLFIFREMGLMPDNFFTRYFVQMGTLIQVIAFALGLASRNQQLEDIISRLQLSELRFKKLNQVKDKLFSIISHDLRNPLATMQSALKIITEHHDKLEENEKEKLTIEAQASLDNLNELLYNLLQWSRSQMNLLEFNPERIEIKPLVEGCIKILQLNAHMKHIRINMIAEEGLSGFADKNMIEFILRNLLSNAIKFSNRDSDVYLKVTSHNNLIKFQVMDHGIGMAKADIQRLLELNATDSTRGTEKEKGTGLGLLISKDFIEKNKGRLEIESELGSGSTFSFSIPAAE